MTELTKPEPIREIDILWISNEAKKLGALDGLHCLRDPMRGGIATTLNEIAIVSADVAEPLVARIRQIATTLRPVSVL